MSTNCSSLLKEHGWKLWFSNFLGYTLLFWIISWVSTSASFPMSCGEFSDSMNTMFSSPMGLIKFLVFAGLFMVVPAFLQSAGTSITVDAVSNNRSSIDTYFCQGIANLGNMYRLTWASLVCYIPAIFVSKHASFAFADFSFSNDNVLSLLSIILYLVTTLALLHAPYILVTENTTACNALRQSWNLCVNKWWDVCISLFNVAAIYGIVIGSTYYFNPDIFNSLHPLRFFLASLALSLSMFAVAYKYFKRFSADVSAHISGGCWTSSTCADTPADTSCSETTVKSTCADTPKKKESTSCIEKPSIGQDSAEDHCVEASCETSDDDSEEQEKSSKKSKKK